MILNVRRPTLFFFIISGSFLAGGKSFLDDCANHSSRGVPYTISKTILKAHFFTSHQDNDNDNDNEK